MRRLKLLLHGRKTGERSENFFEKPQFYYNNLKYVYFMVVYKIFFVFLPHNYFQTMFNLKITSYE